MTLWGHLYSERYNHMLPHCAASNGDATLPRNSKTLQNDHLHRPPYLNIYYVLLSY